MADTKTSWILELVDRISAPMKGIMNATGKTESVVDRVSTSMDKMSDAGKQAATSLIKDHKELQDLIAHTEGRIKKNTEALNAWDDTHPLKKELKVDVDKAIVDLKEYKEWLVEIEDKLTELEKQPNKDKVKKNWGEIALYANQAFELTQKLIDGTRFAADIASVRVNVQRATDLTGDALDDITAKIHHVSKVYDEDSMDILRAANATSKQMGISFDEALQLIEAGFEKGANLNGDMLDQLKEYGPQLKAAGLSAAEGIAIMAKAGKEGVFSDKALDAIKEANLSLREMGQPQVDALKAVGIEVKDLAGKTTFEAVQMITDAMQGATVQARQMVLADIFKGAGEDAGLNFIQGLNSVDLDINNIPSVQEAGSGVKGWLADLQSSFASTFGNIAVYAQQFGGVAQWISAGIPLFQNLSKVTWLQNTATKALAFGQRLLNAAFISSPIGWVVAGLAAVTLGVKYAWDKFEGFRAVLYGLWETFKQVCETSKGLFVAVFAPIGDAIMAVKEGRWGDAAKAVFQLNPISTAARTVKYIAGGGLTKGIGEAYARGDAKGRQSFRDDQQEEQSPAANPAFSNVRDYEVLDGKMVPTNKGGGKGKKKLGLDIVGSGFSEGSVSSSGFSGGGGSGSSSRSVVNNNYITNNFNGVMNDSDIMKIAEKVVRFITNGLKDGQVSIG